ncbi:class I lanthipeptide [Ulvibacterium marinum]|uniref:class I lanthipeptide n=1 Tax=Ulvibacterium marinum TaxID=2419782 RepID=UPI001B87E8DA
MKKAKFSGKLSLSKKKISNLAARSIVGGAGSDGNSYILSCSIGCPTDTTNNNCTSGTSVVISCC